MDDVALTDGASEDQVIQRPIQTSEASMAKTLIQNSGSTSFVFNPQGSAKLVGGLFLRDGASGGRELESSPRGIGVVVSCVCVGYRLFLGVIRRKCAESLWGFPSL